MNPIRKIAAYLTAILLLGCVIQGEILWLFEILEAQVLQEQTQKDGFEVYQEVVKRKMSALPREISQTSVQ